MDPRSLDLEGPGPSHQRPLLSFPVAHHQTVTLTVDQLLVPVDVLGYLGFERRHQHAAGTLGHQLIETAGQVVAVVVVADYLQHQACSFPTGHNRRNPYFRFGRVRRPLTQTWSSTTFGYTSGKERNKHRNKRLGKDHPSGKSVVIGGRSRDGRVTASVVDAADRPTLYGLIHNHVQDGSTVYTDGAEGYRGIDRTGHDLEYAAVRHSIGEYVRGEVHTNGVESLWSLLKRGYYGTYHKMSFKHLARFVVEFAARHNVRDLNAIDQMAALVKAMEGKRLRYANLTAGEHVCGPQPGTLVRGRTGA